MSLKLEIYLPNENADFINHLESLITGIGDLVSVDYGNLSPEDDFNLENLKSFIIIKNEELPAPENFQNTDMYFIIPIKENK
jgi:hypothetical protein